MSPVWHWFLPSSGDGRDVTNVISTAGQTRAGTALVGSLSLIHI